MAPTGKAALRLQQLTGRSATTIHAPLYTKVRQQADGSIEFGDPQAIAGHKEVVLCDEASMLGVDLLRDMLQMLPKTARLILFGDKAQLKPIDGHWGPRFESPTAELTEIHRQALTSPILRLSQGIRMGHDWKGFDWVGAGEDCRRATPGRMSDAAKWLVAERDAGRDATLLTYTNASRLAINAEVRRLLGRTADVERGDRLVCCRNNKTFGIYNGEVRQVEKVTYIPGAGFVTIQWVGPYVDCGIIPQYLGVPKGAPDEFMPQYKKLETSVVLAEYGDCLTIHKAQGSQWDSVGIYHDFGFMAHRDADQYQRLMYTAVTRAAKQLVFFEGK